MSSVIPLTAELFQDKRVYIRLVVQHALTREYFNRVIEWTCHLSTRVQSRIGNTGRSYCRLSNYADAKIKLKGSIEL